MLDEQLTKIDHGVAANNQKVTRLENTVSGRLPGDNHSNHIVRDRACDVPCVVIPDYGGEACIKSGHGTLRRGEHDDFSMTI
jgi:hypothetical protein